MGTARIKTPALPDAPQTREACTAAIRQIGIAQRELERIETQLNEELAAVKAKHDPKAEPFRAQIEELAEGVRLWCEAHRKELLAGGAKTVDLGAGEVKWRMRPPSVTVRGAEKVIEKLKELGLRKFLRFKTEINKEAILAEPPDSAAATKLNTVKGVEINQVEDFIIEPFETHLEAVRGGRR